MNIELNKWQGSVSILPGIGAFVGRSGDNAEHKHWAHQVSIALDNDVVISSGEQSIRGKALFIPANTVHSLQPGTALSIFVDPSTYLAKVLLDSIKPSSNACEIPDDLTQKILNCFDNTNELRKGSMKLQQTLCTPKSSASDRRTTLVFDKLQGILQGNDVTRDDLAKLTCLSPSRFSHWFKEETGMPLRSYRKWLHLISGIEAILSGESFQAAAYGANFSDQAHFTRTFKQAFGASPSAALSNIQNQRKL